MTTLPPSEQREAAGITTIRRGIAYALHLLKKVSGTEVDIARQVGVSGTEINARMIARITMNYDESVYLLYGSNPLKGLQPLTTETVNHSYGNLAAGNGYPIPTMPGEVNTLELYLVWLTNLLIATEAAQSPPKIDSVKISQGRNSQGFTLKWDYVIPFNYLTFAQTGNLIGAVDIATTPDPDPDPVSTEFDNTTIINNAFLVGN